MSWMMWCVMLSLLRSALDYGLLWIMFIYHCARWTIIVAEKYTQVYITLMTVYLLISAFGEYDSTVYDIYCLAMMPKHLHNLIDWHVLDRDIVYTWLSWLSGFGPDPMTIWWDMLNAGLNGPLSDVIYWPESFSSDDDSYSDDNDDLPGLVDSDSEDLPGLVVD